MSECDCMIPMLEGAGQHALGCSIFKDDRSVCCDAPTRFQVDYGNGTVLTICQRCDDQCRVKPDERERGS